MSFFAATIALSAFLLFGVQPIMAKMILPWFGGTSAVWSTCMLFFQVVLLLGYLYAHWLHEKLRPRQQAMVHIGVLAASLFSLPILPNPAWKTASVADPSLRILLLLALTVGLPYFLLSSTSPLLQTWYSRRHRAGMPYRLFALSNAASMLALLSYPLLVEPMLPTRVQGWVWSAAYVCFVAICAVTAWRSSTDAAMEAAPAVDEVVDPPPELGRRFIWLALAGCASVLLLSVTTHLTQDIAAIPFLWILPLSIYLLTFIICFESPRVYLRAIFLPLLVLALAFLAYRLWPYRETVWPYRTMPMRLTIAACAASLFVCCMVLHGELVRLKPHPRYLTGFYVTVSLGGALGGLFVSLLAPAIFRAYNEFPIGLALCALLVFRVVAPDVQEFEPPRRWLALGLMVILIFGYIGGLFKIMQEMVTGYRLVARNFYGQLKVQDDNDLAEYSNRTLVHGTINHGSQYFHELYRREPVTYFCPPSGIGRAMRAQQGKPRRIGILGLGCGTLAAYGQPGDIVHIYEINPLVLEIANRDFTYLKDTRAKVEVTMGDGRLALEAEPSQQFDVLVMDAFSGDSVPVHLITEEAFRTYFRHLKPDGILAVNITNTYLDLEPVMARAADAFGKVAYAYDYDADSGDLICFSCSWALVLSPASLAEHPQLKTGAKLLTPRPSFRLWTDDFSNMLSILK